MSRRSRACEFSSEARKRIKERDGGCIFCRLGYMLPPEDEFYTSTHRYQIMHFIPRSQGGLGIPENGAVGCLWHHNMLDNGNDGLREDMLIIFEAYLRARCENWNKKNLTFDKWGGLKGENYADDRKGDMQEIPRS